MLRSLFLALFLLVPTAAIADCVILLHGLARSSTSMILMEKALAGVGYDVVNLDYPSKTGRVEDIADSNIPTFLSKCPKDVEVHFVTHSMGGILLRYYLSKPDTKPIKLGRVVMLAPPNKGSEIVNKLGSVFGFDWIAGEAAQQLSAAPDSLPNRLGPFKHDLGVIAGNQTISALSTLVPGDDDGKVSVESTKLEGMNDHIVLPVTHTFMMNDLDVIMQVAHYLREGKFKRISSN